jgi:hypothetical protein
LHKIKFSILVFGLLVANTHNVFAMLSDAIKAEYREQIKELSKFLRKDETEDNLENASMQLENIRQQTCNLEPGLAKRAQNNKNIADKLLQLKRNNARTNSVNTLYLGAWDLQVHVGVVPNLLENGGFEHINVKENTNKIDS